MTARITNAALVARMDATDATLAGLTTALTALTGIVTTLAQGQHSTPSVVAQITSAPSARRTASPRTGRPLTGAALAKHEAKVARDAALTPAQVAAADQDKTAKREAYLARKDALSPLNKALFATGLVTGDAWAGRFANTDAVTAALATLTSAQRKAAVAALASK